MSTIILLLAVTVAAGAVFSLALLWRRLAPRASAARRHRVMLSAFVAAAALPLLALALPGWDLPGWGLFDAPSGGHLTGPAFEAPAGARFAHATAADGGSAGVPEAGPAAAAPPAWLASTLLAFWLVGTGVLLARLVRARRWARELLACSRPMPRRDLVDRHRRLCVELGLPRSVTLGISYEAPVPLSLGVRRPCVVLPATAADWSVADFEVVLRHELAHVARRDNAALQLAHAVCALYWILPPAWLALRAMARDAEAACDDRILDGPSPASACARVLLGIAAGLAAQPSMAAPVPRAAAIALAAEPDVKPRLRRLLDPAADRRRAGRLATAATLLLLLLPALPLASLRQAATGSPPPPPPESGDAVFADFESGRWNGLDEILAEIREARAVTRWRADPALGVALPPGGLRAPDGSWRVDGRDAVLLPGAKYGCIFTTDDGFVELVRRGPEGEVRQRVESIFETVAGPGADPVDGFLGSVLGLFGIADDGWYRAYLLSSSVDGRRVGFDGGSWLPFRDVMNELHGRLAGGRAPAD